MDKMQYICTKEYLASKWNWILMHMCVNLEVMLKEATYKKTVYDTIYFRLHKIHDQKNWLLSFGAGIKNSSILKCTKIQ